MSKIKLYKGSEPSASDSGILQIYAKTDGSLAYKDKSDKEINLDNYPKVDTLNAEVLGTTTTLKADITAFGLLYSVNLAFDYKKSIDDTWTRTTADSVSSLGVKSKELSGLDTATDYDFRPVITDPYNPNFEYIGDVNTVTTDDTYVEQPTLTVEGSPSDVPETPLLEGSTFNVINGSDTHVSTEWRIRRTSDDTVIWTATGS